MAQILLLGKGPEEYIGLGACLWEKIARFFALVGVKKFECFTVKFLETWVHVV